MTKKTKCAGGCGKAAIDKPVQACKVCHRPYITHAQCGRKSKGKGRSYESHIAKKLSKWWGRDKAFRRTPSSGGWDRDRAPCDMVVPDGFPFDVECKKNEGWELVQLLKSPDKSLLAKFWAQAADECRPGRSPWLIFSRNNQPDFVMMRFASWGRLSKLFGQVVGTFKYRGPDGAGLMICLLDELLDCIDSEVFRAMS